MRRLITQIARTPVEGPPRQTHVQGPWHTEATTALAAGRSDEAIAAALNTHGLRSGRGNPCTADAVAWLRFKYGIRPPGSEPRIAARPAARPDGRFSTRALAIRLGVTISTIHYWRKHGIIPAIQETASGPWGHTVTPDILAALGTHIRRLPRRTDALGLPTAY